MKEDKNPKSHVSWCWKQKRGIKLEQPNANLCNVYIKKAKSSLNMLESATEKDEIDWISTTAYYARYFAFYALLQKCGIKSEIHDCTISLMSFLFVEDNLVEEHFYKELQLAKELRVDTQYYVTEEIDLDKLKKDSETARSFVLKMEEVIENLTEEQVKTIREKLNNARP
ncbi:MAG: HEPN domain-containing protein [Nanoarchaeota archaeon]|nr:HEPN domain-containing protein [Nanoarchaeota archaeon]